MRRRSNESQDDFRGLGAGGPGTRPASVVACQWIAQVHVDPGRVDRRTAVDTIQARYRRSTMQGLTGIDARRTVDREITAILVERVTRDRTFAARPRNRARVTWWGTDSTRRLSRRACRRVRRTGRSGFGGLVKVGGRGESSVVANITAYQEPTLTRGPGRRPTVASRRGGLVRQWRALSRTTAGNDLVNDQGGRERSSTVARFPSEHREVPAGLHGRSAGRNGDRASATVRTADAVVPGRRLVRVGAARLPLHRGDASRIWREQAAATASDAEL